MGVNIKGYEYYNIPGEIRMRYPAPGSVALDEVSYPHLFKKHWKTPFRDSQFNIRRKEKKGYLRCEHSTLYIRISLMGSSYLALTFWHAIT